ncbi:MAG: polysaccharide deacetylase family protein [Clostridiales bacterium]|nr:polysaccharide deacetylase family protein [Clostridiales bacterium]
MGRDCSRFRRGVLTLFTAVCLLLTGCGAVPTTNQAEESKGTRLPIVMYHSILREPKSFGDYIITPQQLESDLRYLKDHGYTAVTMAQVIAYVKQGEPLPQKPVVLTFDDGYYNNYVYAYPLLREYGMKGIISIVGDYTDHDTKLNENNANYSYLTWEQITEMSESGVIEFQNHTYCMHNLKSGRKGCRRKKGESEEAYHEALRSDIVPLQQKIKEHTGREPDTFTYPFGAVSTESYPVIREIGFSASLSCESGVSVVTKGDEDCLYMLKRSLRTHADTSESFFRKIL